VAAARPGDGTTELVMPTGAAIVAALARTEPVPVRRRRGRPTALATAGRSAEPCASLRHRRDGASGHDDVVVLEATIDDASPQLYEHAIERLLRRARRTSSRAGRHEEEPPGRHARVLAAPADRDRLPDRLRGDADDRTAVDVAPARAAARGGDRRDAVGLVRVKIARGLDGSRNVAPEYEDCRCSPSSGVALKHVIQAALAAAGPLVSG
jgi:uncharacterized protein (DUF111 family)